MRGQMIIINLDSVIPKIGEERLSCRTACARYRSWDLETKRPTWQAEIVHSVEFWEIRAF